MAKDLETLVQLHSEATANAYSVLLIIAEQGASTGFAVVPNKIIEERSRLSPSTVYRATRSLVRLGELTVIDQRDKGLPNLYQIRIEALLKKPKRLSISALEMTPELSQALKDQENSTQGGHVNLTGGGHVNLTGGACQSDMGSTPAPNKEHAHARAVSELIQYSELNELNSAKKISTGKPRKSNPFESNASKAASFNLTEELRQWAETKCPLVPVEETTNRWREFVATQMQDKVQKPVAHWRNFMRQQQTWREEEAKERANGLVGAGQTYAPPVRASVETGAANGAAGSVVGTPQTAAPGVRVLSDEEAQVFAQMLIEDRSFEQLRAFVAGTYPNIAAPVHGQWRAMAEAALQ